MPDAVERGLRAARLLHDAGEPLHGLVPVVRMNDLEGLERDKLLGRITKDSHDGRADIRDIPVGVHEGNDIEAVLDEGPKPLVVNRVEQRS